jgi:hypothetical protein
MALFDEASPICRGKNLSWETVLLFYNNMPREAMPRAQFHAYTESKINGWTTTHSQIARQLAFYYEENGICYPRFTKEMSYADLFKYMQNWAVKYFVPNPYAPSLKNYTPTCIYSAIQNSIDSGESNFDTILDSIFGIKLSSHDKVRVYLNNFTDLIIDDAKRVFVNNRTYGVQSTLHPDAIFAVDSHKYFDYFTIDTAVLAQTNRVDNKLLSLQKIFYGAPGTGKSHRIKKQLNEMNVPKENVFRTTFHPDSDYSTFVGAYKPTMKRQYRYDGKVKAKYYEDDDLAGARKDDVIIDKVIQYDFVPQVFIKAYTRAYQTDENVYLIIEEINRGNCAQIFGDLFQLLDRDKNGVSEYTIKADADVRTYLEDVLGVDSDGIKDGELSFPSNLYIYATMNTSDQSLFPIDSAFKRRWDWEYEPIKYKNNDWVIDIDGIKYQWTSFQKKVNNKIYYATNSEDKMLGDFFVNPSDGIISKELLLNKVLFYLWNDVCKDGDGDIFKTEDNKDIKFSDLYGDNSTNMLLSMMKHLEVAVLESEEDVVDDEEHNGNNFDKYSLNGSEPKGKSDLGLSIMKKYIEEHPNLTFADLKETFPDSMLGDFSYKGLIVKADVQLDSYSRYYTAKEYKTSDNVSYKIYKQWTVDNIENIISFAQKQGWTIEKKEPWERKDNKA